MLHLIPAPLHRLLYRVAYRVRRQWWRIRRPRHCAVTVVAFDEQERVLLVRHSYGPPLWSLPGGGVDRGEDPHHAAQREIREELGCSLTDMIPVEVREERVAGSLVRRHLYAARLIGAPVPDMREIVALQFFEPRALPDRSGARTRRRIEQALAVRAGTSS